MLLPMGDITKAEARARAAEHGFRKVATKKDSIGVCFARWTIGPFKRLVGQKWSDVGQ